MDSITVATRKSRRHKLVATYRALDKLDFCLSPADLKQVGIQRLPMTLQGTNCPEYFAPYKSAIEKPDTDMVVDYIPFHQAPFYNTQLLAIWLNEYFQNCVLPNGESDPAGVSYADWGDFGFGDLVDLTRGSRWQVKTTWHMPRSGVPHIVAMMFSEMTEGDALFHGEIKTAIRIMHRRLKTPALRSHVLAPVLLFSAIGEHHLRVIEAYHNGEQLVMRTTPLYDLSQRDDDLFIKLSRWCIGGPSSKSTMLG